MAVRDGEVVTTRNLDLVRVTGSRLVPLLSSRGPASALHIRRTALMDIDIVRLDARGDTFFAASVLKGVAGRGPGCRNRILEYTAAGTLHPVRSLRTSICR